METEKPDYAAWIGFDWGSEKHSVCLQPADSNATQRSTLEQKPAMLHDWIISLLTRFGGRKIALGIEQTRGAVIHFLLAFDFVHIYPIHPKSLKNYRAALHPSGAKDDPSDAELLMRFLMLHHYKLRPWVPDKPEIRLLLRLVEFRRKAVGRRVRITNELTQLLKEYFPGALEWAGDLERPMACDFLSKWPTLEKLQKSTPTAITKFYRQHNSRNSFAIDERVKQIRSAVALTKDKSIIESSESMVKTLIPQLRLLLGAIAEFEKRIECIYQQHPDAAIFSSFPGAGQTMAPRLLATIGSDRSRFNSPLDLAQYSGIAPVTERSGKSKWVHRRFACSRFIKQGFHEFASHSIPHCDWARAYYHHKRQQGKTHQEAIRVLAYKWIRIIYRCWKDRIPYQETTYLRSLQQKQPQWTESTDCQLFVFDD
jgi:transposase